MSRKTRKIRARWFIKGVLELVTPTHLSNGDADPSVDLPIVTDPLTGCALLSGASLAGALRHYLNTYYGSYVYERDKRSQQLVLREKPNGVTSLLFGGRPGDELGEQSPLIVEDALGREERPALDLRDGVRIDPTTRTAVDKAKFDLQLLAAGNLFDIAFELLISEDLLEQEQQLREALAVILFGLQEGEINLGGRKCRGYGECRVTSWELWQYDLATKSGLHDWLAHDRSWASRAPQKSEDILALLGLAQEDLPPDQRERFTMEVKFIIDGSVLIRSGFEAESGPDSSHLSAVRPGSADPVPILSGTSLAGVIRGQALRIAHTVSGDRRTADELVNNLFGYMEGQNAKAASRVKVAETEIYGDKHHLVQSRVAIDRFTGGAFESALFTEQPVFGGRAVVRMDIQESTDAEIGLLLLVLKDLWTGHTPIGGESSVGRGRFKGETAVLQQNNPDLNWTITADGDQLQIEGDAAALEGFVQAFVEEVAK